jgi:hypothetical protein
VLQVAAPAVAPHESHGHVGVGVDQTGHEHLAGAVDGAVKFPGRAKGPHRSDFGALHRHKGVLQHRIRRVHRHNGGVRKQN